MFKFLGIVFTYSMCVREIKRCLLLWVCKRCCLQNSQNLLPDNVVASDSLCCIGLTLGALIWSHLHASGIILRWWQILPEGSSHLKKKCLDCFSSPSVATSLREAFPRWWCQRASCEQSKYIQNFLFSSIITSSLDMIHLNQTGFILNEFACVTNRVKICLPA